jgi:hypothetical protein
LVFGTGIATAERTLPTTTMNLLHLYLIIGVSGLIGIILCVFDAMTQGNEEWDESYRYKKKKTRKIRKSEEDS